MYQPEETIYLEPDCPKCGSPDHGEGRMWCQDDVWSGPCEGCGTELKAHRYKLVND